MGQERVDWIRLPEPSDKYRAAINKVTNIAVS